MNLLDENFPDDQRSLLRGWRIPFRQIGPDAGHFGAKDDNIIPLLHAQRRVTFFTQDQDFYHRQLGHPGYCLVWLDVKADDAARCVRRFLRHLRFDSQAKRVGLVVRVHPEGIHFWQLNRPTLQSAAWPED